MSRAEQLLYIAVRLVEANPAFSAVLGPGAGNRATNAFMGALRDEAASSFGGDYCEKALCGDNNFRVDFYFPEEATIVEVALGLQNPNSEFEKDILKAVVAKRHGHAVKRLFFIGRAGAQAKCSQPGRRQIIEWAKATQELTIEVRELPGEQRRRTRRASTR